MARTSMLLAAIAFGLFAISCGGAAQEEDASTASDANNDAAQQMPEGDDAEGESEAKDPEDEDTMGGDCEPIRVASEQVAQHADPAQGTFMVEADGDGWTAEVDASVGGIMNAASSSFVYVDLDNQEMLDLSDVDAFTDDQWEIALKRTEIRINSADSGPRSLLLGKTEAADFAQAMPPSPQGGDWVSDDFVTDACEVVTFGRGSLQTAFGQWYDYNPMTHTVSAPENTVYFLYDSVTHAVIKFQITSYADGVYSMRWE